MKNILILLILLPQVLFAKNKTHSIQPEPSFKLEGIQDSIYSAFLETVVSNNDTKLNALGKNLKALSKQRDLDIVSYWRTYHAYYTALYLVNTGREDEAEDLVDDHIDLMEDIKNPTAEDLALTSLIRSFSIQFKAMFRAPFISGRVGRDLDKALTMAPNNPRVLYVKANSNYYTPGQFGGGSQVESLLTDVLSQPDPKIQNPVLPSWGKRESYELLLQWYIRKKEKEKAELLLEEALADFPGHYRIQLIGKQIKDM